MPQPDNPKLYDALTSQAMAKYPSHKNPSGLSPAAGKWRQNAYLSQGGGFVNSIQQVDPKNRDFKQEEQNKIKAREKAKKALLKKRGFVV
jgi:hypothetical protein